jgi:hypothetical protein
MFRTSPPPNTGSEEEKERIHRSISALGLCGAANDVKWGSLLDAMRERKGWKPSYRYKCVGSPHISRWDCEWWYHLPLPMMSVEWFDIGSTRQIISRGKLLKPETIDHSEWILAILEEAGFCYDVVGDIIRIHGYLPKSFEALDLTKETLTE